MQVFDEPHYSQRQYDEAIKWVANNNPHFMGETGERAKNTLDSLLYSAIIRWRGTEGQQYTIRAGGYIVVRSWGENRIYIYVDPSVGYCGDDFIRAWQTEYHFEKVAGQKAE